MSHVGVQFEYLDTDGGVREGLFLAFGTAICRRLTAESGELVGLKPGISMHDNHK